MKKGLKVFSTAMLLAIAMGGLASCSLPNAIVTSGVTSSETTTSSNTTTSSEATTSSETTTSKEVVTSSETTISSEVITSSETTTSSSEVQKAPISMNGVAYETIAQALAAIPTSGDTGVYTITLQKGTYTENGLSYKGSATIKISGDTTTKYGADVVIKGRGSDMSTEKTRDLIEIQGTGNIILENVSLESDIVRTADRTNDVQAEVLGTDTTGYTVAYNCGFKSHQDTLRTAGKAWFYGCYVEGDTDFIWMEEAGKVALYEECEIVSVYDENAATHASYLTAPRMGVSNKVGKGLVIYNSVVRESEEAAANGQETYLARTPWSKDYYNQVAYINTKCSGVESSVWYKSQIATEYAKTIIGWKMDQATADSLGYAGNDDIVDSNTVSKEFNGRKTILNRIYNTGKQKYEIDSENNWDIDSLIASNGWSVTTDESKSLLDGETYVEPTTYLFDGSVDQSALCNGFTFEEGKTHYRGNAGATITIPVSGKCYVAVYGYYAGTVETKADTQGEAVMFFNNGSTNTQIENDYVVYDEAAGTVTITAEATTYITKIVVTPDSTIEAKQVSSMEISGSTTNYCVGVALKLTAAITPSDATNKSVKWSSSNEAIATIDQYTGKVTFLDAGEVTFTATALDGSGVTATFTCSAINPTWVAAEWYSTDESALAASDDALEAGNFSNSAGVKKLKATYTFTNLAGETVSTTVGLKLNSSGSMSVATTKAATLTLIVADVTANYPSLIIATPNCTNGTTTIEPTIVTDGDLIYYTYELTEAGTWTITRGSSAKENMPIIYASVVYPTNINYVWSTEGASQASGEAVESTETIKFTNCVKHDGTYIRLTTDNSVKVLMYAGSTLIVNMPYSSGVTLNGEAVTLDSNNNLVYTADKSGFVTITGAAGNAYITSIKVVKKVSSLSYVFYKLAEIPAKGDEVPSTNEITFTGCYSHDGKQHIILKENNAVSLYLAKGATLTVGMNYTSGDVTVNGEVVALDASKNLVYTAAEDMMVTISGVAGKAYIQSITVTPAAEEGAENTNVIAETTTISFGSDANYTSVKGFAYTATINANGGNSQVKEGTLTLTVKAGAVVKVYGYGGEATENSGSYTSYTVTANGTTSETQTMDYEVTVAEDGDVVITPVDGNNYLVKITVTYNA